MTKIRTLTLSDVEAVAKLEAECFSAPWTAESLSSALSRADFIGYVAETDGVIEGYVFGSVLFEEAELHRIAVKTTRRGAGLGGDVFDAFLQGAKARGGERMFLEVRVSNAPARRLYERRGFERFRTRRYYYDDGEDALEMKKEL